IASACVRAPGTVEIAFSFADPAPDPIPKGLWFHVVVEARASRTVLASDKVELTPDSKISLDGIPNGDDRIAIAEIRDRPDRMSSHALFYGESQPFSISPGESARVAVSIELRRAPAIAD